MARLSTIPARLGALPMRVRPLPKPVDAFYTSPEWRRLVADIKRMRGPFCQRCGSNAGLVADHIVERRDGGADLDAQNIELLCAAHHNAKTAEARRRRAAGPGSVG